jgi:peptidoglycan DL-endopeptidase CwlO
MHRRALRRRVPFALAVALLAATWTETAVALTDSMPVTDARAEQRDRASGPGARALAAARDAIGSGYAMGATGPGAFDCSGLTLHAFGRAGVALPHSSFAQYGMGRAVARDAVRAGDLVFFSTAGAGASHVGIATGRGTAVSATSSGVMEHPVSDAYWGGAYVGARRISG